MVVSLSLSLSLSIFLPSIALSGDQGSSKGKQPFKCAITFLDASLAADGSVTAEAASDAAHVAFLVGHHVQELH